MGALFYVILILLMATLGSTVAAGRSDNQFDRARYTVGAVVAFVVTVVVTIIWVRSDVFAD